MYRAIFRVQLHGLTSVVLEAADAADARAQVERMIRSGELHGPVLGVTLVAPAVERGPTMSPRGGAGPCRE